MLKTNHYKVDIKSRNLVIYHYDVDIRDHLDKKDIPKKKKGSVWS